jgi:hypothetical protein
VSLCLKLDLDLPIPRWVLTLAYRAVPVRFLFSLHHRDLSSTQGRDRGEHVSPPEPTVVKSTILMKSMML